MNLTSGDKLLVWLHHKTISYGDLAKKIGVSPRTVANWVNNKYQMPDDLARQLDNYFLSDDGAKPVNKTDNLKVAVKELFSAVPVDKLPPTIDLHTRYMRDEIDLDEYRRLGGDQ